MRLGLPRVANWIQAMGLVTASYPVDGQPLDPARFLEAQPQRGNSRSRLRACNQRLQSPSQSFAIDSESVTHIYKRERAGTARAKNPSPGFGEDRALASGFRMRKVLDNVDRVGKDGEHQTLLAGKLFSSDQLEELAAEYYIRKGPDF